MTKNKGVSIILTFILYLGYVYLGEYKRFVYAWIVAIILQAIIALIFGYETMSVYGSNGFYVSTGVGLLYLIYLLYDTIVCTDSINNEEELPKFLGVL